MQTFIPGPLSDHARNLMRRLGYGELGKSSGQTSFAKRISGADFPRFHAYVENKDGGIEINLHLDQKGASHEGSHAHSGEYAGPLVEQEMKIIVYNIDLIKNDQFGNTPKPSPSSSDKKSKFWG